MSATRIWTVWSPPKRVADPEQRALRTQFVCEGFSWLALLFAPLWLIVHGMWVILLAFILVSVALESAAMRFGVAPGWTSAGFAVVFAYEARALRRWALARRGWTMEAILAAPNREAVERRYFGGAGAPAARSEQIPFDFAASGPAAAPAAG